MESDATNKSTASRAGAVSAPAAPSGYERLLRRRAKPLSADLFLAVADWLQTERRKSGRTQKAMAQHHRIPLRQVKTYEAVARWPSEAKALIGASPATFLVSDLTRLFANRSWRSKETLLNALRRHAAGKPPRKRAGARDATQKDPNVLALEDRLRSRLQTRVSLVGEGATGEIRLSYFSYDELDRLLGILGA